MRVVGEGCTDLWPLPDELEGWSLVVEDGGLRRREVWVLPKLATLQTPSFYPLIVTHPQTWNKLEVNYTLNKYAGLK